MSMRNNLVKDLGFLVKASEKAEKIMKESGVEVRVHVPQGAEEKFKKALDAAFSDALKASGITVEHDEAGLNKAAKSIARAIEADIQELKRPEYGWMVKKLEEKPVDGIECIPPCEILCFVTVEVGQIPALVVGWAGGCAAICALSGAIATVVAAAA